MQVKPARFIHRYNTAAVWIANNPILKEGEIGIEFDTQRVKLGDGTHTWTELEYRINNDVGNMYHIGETIRKSGAGQLNANLTYEIWGDNE